MFGQKDDDQQQQTPQTADPGVLNAAMPDPITPDPPAGFNIPANGSTAEPITPSEPAFSAPELPTSGTPDPVTPTSDPSTSSAPVSDDLVGIKQQALQHLCPLVGHLDQTPEEKFRTTMMMIQASDNQDLIKEAFEAAQKITDDKARAQALLDVINEINYFTQHEHEA